MTTAIRWRRCLQGVHHALRPHRRDPQSKTCSRPSPRSAARWAAESRSGRSSTSAPSIPNRIGATLSDGRWRQGAGRDGVSHGIGVSRLLGAIIEASHDDKGIIWPEGVTPFHVGIVNLKQGDAEADAACDGALQGGGGKQGSGGAVRRPRRTRAGEKFATMDLIGLPWRITVGPRGLANGVVEVTSRRSGVSEEMTPEAAVAGLPRFTPASKARSNARAALR